MTGWSVAQSISGSHPAQGLLHHQSVVRKMSGAAIQSPRQNASLHTWLFSRGAANVVDRFQNYWMESPP